MMRVVPQWKVKVVCTTGVIGEYKISADNLYEVFQWLSKINFFPNDVTHVAIERVKDI